MYVDFSEMHFKQCLTLIPGDLKINLRKVGEQLLSRAYEKIFPDLNYKRVR